MKEVDLAVLGSEDIFDAITNQWMLVTAGTSDSFNTMTANWGGFGHLWNKNVAFIFIRPDRYTHEFIENNERVTLSFYDEQYRTALQICGSKSGRNTDKVAEAGLTPLQLESGAMAFSEARLVIDGRKIYHVDFEEDNFDDWSIFKRWYGSKVDPHTLYILEIEKIYSVK
ncbi:MAG: flavin reductase [Bacteroidales bacterium]|nr:flavin reductase [Bacteroidales bacterium]